MAYQTQFCIAHLSLENKCRTKRNFFLLLMGKPVKTSLKTCFHVNVYRKKMKIKYQLLCKALCFCFLYGHMLCDHIVVISD